MLIYNVLVWFLFLISHKTKRLRNKQLLKSEVVDNSNIYDSDRLPDGSVPRKVAALSR